MLCGLVVRDHHFRGTYYLHLQGWRGSMFLWIVGIYLQVHTVSTQKTSIFICKFTEVHHWIVSRVSKIQSVPSCQVSIRSILILSCLFEIFLYDHFPWNFLNKILQSYPSIYATYPTHPSFNLLSSVICALQSASLCCFLQPPSMPYKYSHYFVFSNLQSMFFPWNKKPSFTIHINRIFLQFFK
jgi:hypothetical protein